MDELDQLCLRVLKRANELENDAGHSGSMTDFGASALRDEVAVFQAGRRGEVPEKWKDFAEAMARESDPEYAEYKRLKQKFENRPMSSKG
jgi:hypothetical protein